MSASLPRHGRTFAPRFLLAAIALQAALLGGVWCQQASGQATTNPEAGKGTPVKPPKTKAKARMGWWNDVVWYEIFVRSFADSRTGPKANDGIGDLQGIIDRLDYLNDGDPATTTDLGITGIWLMPITQSPSYHGYDTTDYRTIESDYGTNEDFKRLLAECHKRGIKVIIDLVPNHCSSSHPWFIEAQDPASPKHDWFIWEKADPAWKGPWGQKVWHQVKGKPQLGYYYGLFNHDMPDLNYRNEQVSAEMIDTCRWWLSEMGIDGFRIDAIRHLIEDGQTQENTPETHAWLRKFALAMQTAKPEVFTVGEVWAPTPQVAAYLKGEAETELDSCFEFDLAAALLKAAGSGEAAPLAKQLATTWEWLPDNQFSTLLSNHDQDRTMTALKGDFQKGKLAASLLLTLPGIPFLYYGEELGMMGAKPDPKLRTPMQWTDGRSAKPATVAPTNEGEPKADEAVARVHLLSPFSTVKPWQGMGPDLSKANVERQTSDQQSLLSTYRKLISLRNGNSAIRRGGFVLGSTTHPAVLAYLRTATEEDPAGGPVLVIANLSGESIEKYTVTVRGAKLPAGEVTLAELFPGEAIGRGAGLTAENNGDIANATPLPRLKPRTVHVLKLNSGR